MTNHVDPRAVLADAVEAHGGDAWWRSVESLRITLSIGGAVIGLKGRSPFARRVTAVVHARKVRVELDFGAGERYRLEGRRLSRVGLDGHEIESWLVEHRSDGRPVRRILWRPSDVAFFLGYALWNYALTPWLLTREDMQVEALEPGALGGRVHQRVRVQFPIDVPTHSPVQDFWFGPDDRLGRLDYTAHVLSRWARGAHEIDAYGHFDGIPFPVRRRVWMRPLPGTAALRLFPVMFGTVHDVEWSRS